MLVHLARVGIGRVDGKRHAGLDGGVDLALDLRQHAGIRQALRLQPAPQQRERIALGAPVRLFFLGAIVGAVDVADVVAVVAVGVADQEAGPFAPPAAVDQLLRRLVDRAAHPGRRLLRV